MQTHQSPAAPPSFPPWRPHRDPWMPPDYDERVIYAVRAFAEGKATEGQQKILFAWMQYVTSPGQLSFRPGGQDGMWNTAFAEGKRFVGIEINKMLSPLLTPPESVAEQIAKASKPKAPPVIHKGNRGKRNAR